MTKSYETMNAQLAALLETCSLPLPCLSNAAALIGQSLDRINWCGFYLAKGETLYLGPFMGKPACTVIPFSRGVCGAAARTGETQLVPDVHLFPGHIACDAASRSEIVLPLYRHGKLFGVLDIDSPETGRFTEEDREGLAEAARILLKAMDDTEGLL